MTGLHQVGVLALSVSLIGLAWCGCLVKQSVQIQQLWCQVAQAWSQQHSCFWHQDERLVLSILQSDVV